MKKTTSIIAVTICSLSFAIARDRTIGNGDLPEFLVEYDLNEDGQIDEEERQAMRDARESDRAKRRAQWDINDDGEIDKTEREIAREALHPKIEEHPRELFNAADIDGDGSLSIEEFNAIPAVARLAERHPQDPHWESLFDGKTLGKWAVTNFTASEGVEIKKDGVIEIRPGEPLGGIRWTGKDDLPLVDYEIALEARRVEGDDFFCCLTFPYKKAHASFVVGGWGGSLTGISSVDHYDASENETNGIGNFDNGTWYKIRLRVTADRIEAWIDDEQSVNLTTTGKIIEMRFGEIEESVPLGVSVFMTTAEVRNLNLKRLEPGAAAASPAIDEF